MELTEFHLRVLRGQVCPYCKSKVGIIQVLNKTEIIVGSSAYFGCVNYPKCDSYTISKSTIFVPLGRLANKPLRIERTRAYKQFNKLKERFSMTESEIYAELSEALKTPIEYTHITMLGLKSCIALTGWCIRKRLKLEYETTGVYTNMSSRREVDGKQKFKRCIIVEHYNDKQTLVQFDDEFRLISNQVRVTRR